jgi:hypothetical protein
MNDDRCLNGMRNCGLTEPHRHEIGGAVVIPRDEPPIRGSVVILPADTEYEFHGESGRRCSQGALGHQCLFLSPHEGPHYFEGLPIPPPFFVPPSDPPPIELEVKWTEVRPLRSHSAICGSGNWPPPNRERGECERPATYATRADFTGGWNAAGAAWMYFCDDHVPPDHEPPEGTPL